VAKNVLSVPPEKTTPFAASLSAIAGSMRVVTNRVWPSSSGVLNDPSIRVSVTVASATSPT
jgi:hypothetical protein